MRATRVSIAIALAAAATFASASPAGTTTRAAVRLPAPITIDAGARRFQVERNGDIRSVPPRILPFPRDVAWVPGTGAWYAIRHRHLIVGRWRRTLWRSSGQYQGTLPIGIVTIGHHAVAFSYRTAGAERLYVSSLDGHERRVAPNEFPLGWTSGGFYAYRYRGHLLLLRTDMGALERVVVRSPASYVYDRTTQSLYFIAGGSVMWAHGGVNEPLASLRRLQLPVRKPDVELDPLGRLVELLTNQRLILLNLDGSLFAETKLPAPAGELAGTVAVAPDGRAVAYTSLSNSGSSGSTGTETVYVLRAGGHIATAVRREHAPDSGCVIQADIQWHGRWLLYSATGGYLSVVDSTARRPATELTNIARRLTSPSSSAFSAYWSGEPPAL
ncbi:MAG: hypothetical protein JO046_02250 [Solirubrobacterales bacterium]|nr:hypothetical protein [Solirubrobacterales bacterium]MBV9680586.1 hypothetical protein [Solirubrobacterales bacterium]